jgi:hypothetical protein
LIPLKDLNSSRLRTQEIEEFKSLKLKRSYLQNESKMEFSQRRKSTEKRSSLSQLKMKEEYENGTMLYLMVRRKSVYVWVYLIIWFFR